MPTFEELYDILGDKTSEFCLLRALLTRGSYGGMHGDIKMMNNYAVLWLSRFQFPGLVSNQISKLKFSQMPSESASS